MYIKKEDVRKILIIKFRGAGDVILSTVMLESLAEAFPGAEIHFLTEPFCEPVLRFNPLIKEIKFFHKDKTGNAELIRMFRKEKYNLIIDTYSNPRTALCTFLSGARYRLGFPYRGRKYAYNLFGPEERTLHHQGTLHLKLLEGAGIRTKDSLPRVWLDDDHIKYGEDYISGSAEKGNTIALIPGGGWASKRCDPEKFAEFGDFLAGVRGYKVVILWGPSDFAEAEKIKALMKNEAVLAPETDFLNMGGILKACKFVVSNDSGPMHLAAALGVPVLALFGPTDPAFHAPLGSTAIVLRLEDLECIVCNLLECNRNHECFKNIDITMFSASVDKLIKGI